MKVKCLIDFGEEGEQERFVVLNNSKDKTDFKSELGGMLWYDREFITDKDEVITGSQIILEIGRRKIMAEKRKVGELSPCCNAPVIDWFGKVEFSFGKQKLKSTLICMECGKPIKEEKNVKKVLEKHRGRRSGEYNLLSERENVEGKNPCEFPRRY